MTKFYVGAKIVGAASFFLKEECGCEIDLLTPPNVVGLDKKESSVTLAEGLSGGKTEGEAQFFYLDPVMFEEMISYLEEIDSQVFCSCGAPLEGKQSHIGICASCEEREEQKAQLEPCPAPFPQKELFGDYNPLNDCFFGGKKVAEQWATETDREGLEVVFKVERGHVCALYEGGGGCALTNEELALLISIVYKVGYNHGGWC